MVRLRFDRPAIQAVRVPRQAAIVLAPVLAFLLLAAAAGCGVVVDRDEVTTCRRTLPAVNPDASSVVVTGVAPAPAPYSVRITYRVAQDGRERTRFVQCAFGDPDSWTAHGLSAFATEEETFTPVRLHILKRYWLEKDGLAAFADPGPGETSVPLLRVPLWLAFLLQAIANALPSTAMMMLVAVAYALIYGLIGRINLAFGELAALGGHAAVLGAAAALSLGLPSAAVGLAVAGILGVGVAALHGRVVERLVFTPLAFGRGQSILVATIALAIVLQEYMRLAEGQQIRWVSPILSAPVAFAASETFVASVTAMQVVIASLALSASLALLALMRWSAFGRRWRATADDPLMASLIGISPRAVLATTFLVAAALAGLAGFVMTAQYGGAGFAAGTMVGLKGLVAAVVGGIGSIGGALLGGLAVGAFEAFWSAYLPIEQRDLAVLLMLVAIFVLRPGGLFGWSEPERSV
jgi:branched-chain amino acid transport system permease protein